VRLAIEALRDGAPPPRIARAPHLLDAGAAEAAK